MRCVPWKADWPRGTLGSMRRIFSGDDRAAEGENVGVIRWGKDDESNGGGDCLEFLDFFREVVEVDDGKTSSECFALIFLTP